MSPVEPFSSDSELEKQNTSDRISLGSDSFASVGLTAEFVPWLRLQAAPLSDPCSLTGRSDKLISHMTGGNRRPGLISRRDENDGEKEAEEGEKIENQNEEDFISKSWLTLGYLFMGLLKRTLKQSALPSSQQP